MLTEFRGQWPQTAIPPLTAACPAVGSSVPRLRAAVADYAAQAGATPAQLDAVRLAVTEAVTNVVRHAYRAQPGDIHLTAAVVQGELWVLVADDGCGHQVAPADPGLGLGLALIARLADEFVLTERAQGGTEARMRFPVAPDAAGD